MRRNAASTRQKGQASRADAAAPNDTSQARQTGAQPRDARSESPRTICFMSPHLRARLDCTSSARRYWLAPVESTIQTFNADGRVRTIATCPEPNARSEHAFVSLAPRLGLVSDDRDEDPIPQLTTRRVCAGNARCRPNLGLIARDLSYSSRKTHSMMSASGRKQTQVRLSKCADHRQAEV